MIELAQHMEAPLLENDCVIVPSLSGFTTHYAPVMRVMKENTLLSPTRTIGFNPQLKMNGRLLVQSYMVVYGTDFSNATKIVDKTVKELLSLPHKDGEADLPNMSESRYSIHNTYGSVPHDNKITTPHLYGLDCFEVQELAVLHKPHDNRAAPFTSAVQKEKKRAYRIGIDPPYLTNTAAMIAIVALFSLFSTPIENTEVAGASYIRLPSGDLSEQTERQSLTITPIVARQRPGAKKARAFQANLSQTANKKTVAPVVVREVKARRQPVAVSASYLETEAVPITSTLQPANMPYHIIVASVSTEKDANAMAQQLITRGYAGAKAITDDGKMHVSIQSYATEKEAYRASNRIRLDETCQSARVLKK